MLQWRDMAVHRTLGRPMSDTRPSPLDYGKHVGAHLVVWLFVGIAIWLTSRTAPCQGGCAVEHAFGAYAIVAMGVGASAVIVLVQLALLLREVRKVRRRTRW
jgi:hypothetical protein